MSGLERTSNYWKPRPDFKVVIYESELRQIQAWTAKCPNIETGGDLFGLWLDETTAVVQLVLGPGQNCKRTAHSFYQDIDYLDRVGNHLTKNEGLCHIGEWHSHHQLGLTRPSGGDENTVWSNMDRYGIHRFVLFIATINSSWTRWKKTAEPGAVNIDGYLFQINRQKGYDMPLQQASSKVFETISTTSTSPFRKPNKECITCGAESLNSDEELNIFRKNAVREAGQEQNAITNDNTNDRSDDEDSSGAEKKGDQKVQKLKDDKIPSACHGKMTTKNGSETTSSFSLKKKSEQEAEPLDKENINKPNKRTGNLQHQAKNKINSASNGNSKTESDLSNNLTMSENSSKKDQGENVTDPPKDIISEAGPSNGQTSSVHATPEKTPNIVDDDPNNEPKKKGFCKCWADSTGNSQSYT